jgi:hypothetical protein
MIVPELAGYLNVGADSRAYRQQLLSRQPEAQFGLTFRVISWLAGIHQKQESGERHPVDFQGA